jgi:hypothetical protein
MPRVSNREATGGKSGIVWPFGNFKSEIAALNSVQAVASDFSEFLRKFGGFCLAGNMLPIVSNPATALIPQAFRARSAACPRVARFLRCIQWVVLH